MLSAYAAMLNGDGHIACGQMLTSGEIMYTFVHRSNALIQNEFAQFRPRKCVQMMTFADEC